MKDEYLWVSGRVLQKQTLWRTARVLNAGTNDDSS
jgi:hypothetical protein